MREEVLLTSDDALLSTLPPALRAEALALRSRYQRNQAMAAAAAAAAAEAPQGLGGAGGAAAGGAAAGGPMRIRVGMPGGVVAADAIPAGARIGVMRGGRLHLMGGPGAGAAAHRGGAAGGVPGTGAAGRPGAAKTDEDEEVGGWQVGRMVWVQVMCCSPAALQRCWPFLATPTRPRSPASLPLHRQAAEGPALLDDGELAALVGLLRSGALQAARAPLQVGGCGTQTHACRDGRIRLKLAFLLP